MTAAEARILAQSDPVQNLTRMAGELTTETRTLLASLTQALKALDRAETTLAEHNIQFKVDLGPIGNAAMAAWRTLENHTTDRTFEMPR